MLSLHFDPDYWGSIDPNEFNPMRFADANKINNMAYLPFGVGPRNCIGMRFALLEIKVTLIKLLRKYTMHESENTPKNLKFFEGIVRRPLNGVPIMLKKRNF